MKKLRNCFQNGAFLVKILIDSVKLFLLFQRLAMVIYKSFNAKGEKGLIKYRCWTKMCANELYSFPVALAFVEHLSDSGESRVVLPLVEL